jgi:putative flippase GtrA
MFRLGNWLRRPSNLWQALRFLLVGGSSYLVNLTVFTVAAEALSLHRLVSAALAFMCAVNVSFFGHRIWTFRAADQQVVRQAIRFVMVCLPAAVSAAGLLQIGVAAGLPQVAAQALAVAVAAPLNFTAYKLWSFAPVFARPAPSSIRN